VKMGLLSKEDGPMTDRSALLDNAKMGAITFIIFGHVIYYNSTHQYKDYLTWFSDSQSVGYVNKIIEFSINAACFLSGSVMRRPLNVARFFNLFFDLALPLLIWTYFLKGFLQANFTDPNWTIDTFKDSLTKIAQGNSYSEEWYLQALVVWRVFSYATGVLNPPVVFALACMFSGMAGYHSLWNSRCNFDTAAGFGLMFVFGLLCPLQKLVAKIPQNFLLQIFGIGVMVCFPLVIDLLGPLPDNHLTYTQGPSTIHFKALQAAASHGSCLAEFNLYWTRRVLRNVLALVVVLVYVVLVVPRDENIFSSLGKYTLYPYLFHEFFNFARDRLIVALDLPVSTNEWVHLLFYTTTVLWAFLVFCFCSSPIFRFFFAPFFEFSWLKVRLFPSSSDGQSGAGRRSVQGERSTDSFLQEKSTEKFLQKSNIDIDMPAVPRTAGGINTVPVDSSQTDGDFDIIARPWIALGEERKFYELPRQKAAEKYYTGLFVSSVVIGLVYYIGFGQIFLPYFIKPYDASMDFIWRTDAFWSYWTRGVIITGFVGALGFRATTQFLKMRRLAQGLKPTPALDNPSGLLHCIVICSYKEPLDILRMTVGSLAKQSFDSKSIHIVLATEARDPTAEESFNTLVTEYGANFGDMMRTVHTLADGEIVGKSSNENHAVRELYKKLAPTHDPYRVMVTVCDVDSLFAHRYIEQLDWTYQQHPNPSQLLYDGPINTYRNYWDADIFIRTFESFRCQLAMSLIWEFQSCQSNYSLTLGMAREINFWCPDNTPEDFHTTMKTFIHTHGGMTVAPVFSIICNDLVSGWGDRYTQAKRHSWGVTESMWALSTYKQVPSPVWIKMFAFVWWDQVGQSIMDPLLLLLVPGFWQFAVGISTFSKAILFGTIAIKQVYEWMEFIAVDLWMFNKVLPIGESEYLPLQTPYQKFMIGLNFMILPVTKFIAVFVFGTIPRLHCLYHAFRSPSLTYIVAPKANNGLCKVS